MKEKGLPLSPEGEILRQNGYFVLCLPKRMPTKKRAEFILDNLNNRSLHKNSPTPPMRTDGENQMKEHLDTSLEKIGTPINSIE